MNIDLLEFEKKLYKKGIKLIAGVDEAGRGPLCGPVVAAAVILPENYKLDGLNDSKKLSEKKREYFYKILQDEAIAIGVGIVGAKEIDELNILEASRKAMYIAIDNLKIRPEYILSDAMDLSGQDISYEAIIHGDARSLSIAAGSVVAKVTRDHIMYEIDREHPEYKLSKHKGYPTKEHIELIKKYGIIEEYRKSFKPVKDFVIEVEKYEEDKKVIST